MIQSKIQRKLQQLLTTLDSQETLTVLIKTKNLSTLTDYLGALTEVGQAPLSYDVAPTLVW